MNRPLMAAVYLVGAGLVLVPVLETLLSVWPLQPGTLSWRFGAAGMLSRGLLTSLLGLLFVVGASVAFDHRRVLRSVALLCGFASALFLLGSLLLALDAVQLRATVNPDARTGYDLAALSAVLKTLHAFLTTGLVAWGGWKLSSARERQAVNRAPEAKVPFRARPLGGDPSPASPLPRGKAP